MDQKMSLAFHVPVRPAASTKSPRQGRVAAAIRHAARAALTGVKQVAQAVFVLGIFAVMLATAASLGVLIWVPHSHLNW